MLSPPLLLLKQTVELIVDMIVESHFCSYFGCKVLLLAVRFAICETEQTSKTPKQRKPTAGRSSPNTFQNQGKGVVSALALPGSFEVLCVQFSCG